jgi:hypothetical protein
VVPPTDPFVPVLRARSGHDWIRAKFVAPVVESGRSPVEASPARLLQPLYEVLGRERAEQLLKGRQPEGSSES